MKAIIYKIECNETGEVYYGSTILDLNTRISIHKSSVKTGKKMCRCSEIIRRGNYSYSLVENVECQDISQLLDREKFHIKNFECVNERIPNRKYREYYEDNQERKKAYQREYYQKNKESIRERRKQQKI